ncbi:hypothetical protein LZ31DRAFT_551787 [Colletotrichum somersetense]|nr:hypothetical protein LZ31DRAFT_551787 [Colletotrichum somersetense]
MQMWFPTPIRLPPPSSLLTYDRSNRMILDETDSLVRPRCTPGFRFITVPLRNMSRLHDLSTLQGIF